MYTNTQHGLIAQNKAELRAIEKGYIVSKPIHECVRYDMIIDDCNSLKRLQVKYAGGKQTSSTGSCVVDFRSRSINGKERSGYAISEIDGVLVYIPFIDKICYFPVEFIRNKSTLTIRYIKPNNNQERGIIYATDYIW